MIKNIENFNIKAEIKDEFIVLPDDIKSKIKEFGTKPEKKLRHYGMESFFVLMK